MTAFSFSVLGLFAVAYAILAFAASLSRARVRRAAASGSVTDAQRRDAHGYGVLLCTLSMLPASTFAKSLVDTLVLREGLPMSAWILALSGAAIALAFASGILHSRWVSESEGAVVTVA